MAFRTEHIPEELRDEVKGYVIKLYGSLPPRNSFFFWAIDEASNAKMFFSDDVDGNGYCLVWGEKIVGVDISTQKPSLPFATDIEVRASRAARTFATIRKSSNISPSEIGFVASLVKEALPVLNSARPSAIIFTDGKSFHINNPFDWFSAATGIGTILLILLLVVALPISIFAAIALTILKWLGLTTLSLW